MRIAHGRESCALDIADRGPLKPVEIAAVTGIVLRRVEQLHGEAFAKLRKNRDASALLEELLGGAMRSGASGRTARVWVGDQLEAESSYLEAAGEGETEEAEDQAESEADRLNRWSSLVLLLILLGVRLRDAWAEATRRIGV